MFIELGLFLALNENDEIIEYQFVNGEGHEEIEDVWKRLKVKHSKFNIHSEGLYCYVDNYAQMRKVIADNFTDKVLQDIFVCILLIVLIVLYYD